MISKRIACITPSVTLAITARAKALKNKGVDVVNFAAGEPDFDTPDYVKEAAIEAIRGGATKYTPASGTLELKEAICKKLSRDNRLDYTPNQIVVSCGAKHALYNLFQVLCNKGDEVIIPSPYWVSYPEMVKLSGATPVFIPTDDEEAFILDPQELRHHITKRTKAILINSPSNPTGAVYQKEVLEKIALIAAEHNLSIVSDEIYEKLIYDNLSHVSIASLSKKLYELTYVINGVSKSHAMTGWRIGYLAGRSDVIKGVGTLQSHSTSNPTSVSQAASLAALSSDDTVLRAMAREFEKRRDIMVSKLAEVKGLKCHRPQGAIYCFVNIAETKLDSVTFSNRLLDEQHVATIPGEPFGRKDYVRFSFATGAEEIEKGIQRVKIWVGQLLKKS